MNLRTRYSQPEKNEEALHCKDKGRTQQHFKNEVDINQIMKQVEKTGMLPENKIGNAFYGDVSEISDFNACQQIVMIAEQSFKELDPNLRERFDNDPGALIDFLEDPDNKAEAIELGLVKPDTVEEVKVPPEASKVPPAAK